MATCGLDVLFFNRQSLKQGHSENLSFLWLVVHRVSFLNISMSLLKYHLSQADVLWLSCPMMSTVSAHCGGLPDPHPAAPLSSFAPSTGRGGNRMNKVGRDKRCSWLLYLLLPQAAQRDGSGGCGQSITAPLGCSFLLTLFPCSLWAVHGLQLPSGHVSLHCGPPWTPCFPMVFSMGCRGISAAGKFPLQHLEHLLPLCWPWCSQGCFSHSSSPLTRPWGVLPFLQYIFPEVPPTWLQGAAMPCCGSVRADWNRLWSRLLTASPALPRQHLGADTQHNINVH